MPLHRQNDSFREKNSRSPDFARPRPPNRNDDMPRSLSPTGPPMPRKNAPEPLAEESKTPETTPRPASSLSQLTGDTEFIAFLKNIILYCSNDDEEDSFHHQVSYKTPHGAKLLRNLNSLKQNFQHYKRTKSVRPSPISRKSINSEPAAAPMYFYPHFPESFSHRSGHPAGYSPVYSPAPQVSQYMVKTSPQYSGVVYSANSSPRSAHWSNYPFLWASHSYL